MHWLVYIFGSGLAFFLGVGGVLLAAALPRRPLVSAVATIVGLIGLGLLVLSAAPLPVWFYVLAIALAGTVLIVRRIPQRVSAKARLAVTTATLLVLLLGAVHEASYLRLPRMSLAATRTLYVFGDSLAAGMGSSTEDNWPELVARSQNLELVNFSVAGATARTALREAEVFQPEGGVVLLEIGGNDVLGSTSAEDFARDLESLLKKVCRGDEQVVMFELPLPPLYNAFGAAQRRLAAQYGVQLIPKRVLISVIAEPQNTSDTIHLTPAGHREMADRVSEILRPAYEP